MTRLIDADALHKALYTKQKWVLHRNGKHNEGFTSDQVHFAIDEQPTIDAVPVIRCKDCKSWRKSYFESVNEMVCNKTRYIMKPDDYCSMAKRKEE